MKRLTVVCTLGTLVAVGCGKQGRAPAPVEAPPATSETASPTTEPTVAADEDRPTTTCAIAATDFMDVVCADAFECETMTLDVGCVAKEGSADTVVCTCSYDFEDQATFEMPRSNCDEQFDGPYLARRCEFPFAIVME